MTTREGNENLEILARILWNKDRTQDYSGTKPLESILTLEAIRLTRVLYSASVSEKSVKIVQLIHTI